MDYMDYINNNQKINLFELVALTTVIATIFLAVYKG